MHQNPCPWEVTHLCGQRAEEMDLDQLDLNPRIIAATKKAKLKSIKEVLHFSGPDLQRLTGLSSPDVQHLLSTASSHLRGRCVITALDLHTHKERFPAQHQRLSLGCPVLDGLLRGGLPLDGITELAGCSSAGKTQLALQLCLVVQFPRQHGGLEAGAVYVCTEDVFPSKRLQQLIAEQQHLRTDIPAETIQKIKFGDHIFIEHAADVVSVPHIQINTIRSLKFRLKWASWTLPARSVGKGGHPARTSPSVPWKRPKLGRVPPAHLATMRGQGQDPLSWQEDAESGFTSASDGEGKPPRWGTRGP